MSRGRPAGKEESYLAVHHFDSATRQWNGPFPVVVDGQPVTGVTGDPALIQSTYGKQGNFEIVVPQGDQLMHYWRDNDALELPWRRGPAIPAPATASALGSVTLALHRPADVSILQSTFGDPRNFELVTRMVPIVEGTGGAGHLAFYYFDGADTTWHGPFPLLADGRPITGATGF
jgi:hypothetical protein